jgi:hypothetical protein
MKLLFVVNPISGKKNKETSTHKNALPELNQ